MKQKRAFTLAESLICMIIIGIVYVIILQLSRPGDIKKEALLKAGVDTFRQIEYATKRILARDTRNYALTSMRIGTTEFSVASSSSLNNMKKLYKKNLPGSRRAVPSSYSNLQLQDGSNTKAGSLKVSSFSGYFLKNGAYFGLKLNNNCTTTEQYIYHPSRTTSRTQSGSCGTIFYDVNGDKGPNTLGVDQYIISLGKQGLR